MGNAVSSVKNRGLAKCNVNLALGYMLVYPLQALKPDQLNRAGFVRQFCDYTFLVFFANLLLAGNPP
ncbi:hypothetical protein D3C86_1672800 [compost metagenome]